MNRGVVQHIDWAAAILRRRLGTPGSLIKPMTCNLPQQRVGCEACGYLYSEPGRCPVCVGPGEEITRGC